MAGTPTAYFFTAQIHSQNDQLKFLRTLIRLPFIQKLFAKIYCTSLSKQQQYFFLLLIIAKNLRIAKCEI